MSNDVLLIMFSILKVTPANVKSSNEAPDVSEFITLKEIRLLLVRLPLDIVFTTLNSSFVNVNVDVADMVYNVVPPPPPPNDVKYVITL
jgi:hypothetical protein